MSNQQLSSRRRSNNRVIPSASGVLLEAVMSEPGQRIIKAAAKKAVGLMTSSIGRSTTTERKEALSSPITSSGVSVASNGQITGLGKFKFLSSGSDNHMRLQGKTYAGQVINNTAANNTRCVFEFVNGTSPGPVQTSFTLESVAFGPVVHQLAEMFAMWRINKLVVHYTPYTNTSVSGNIVFAFAKDVSPWNALQSGRSTVNLLPMSNVRDKMILVSSCENAVSSNVWNPISFCAIRKSTDWAFCSSYAANGFYSNSFLSGDFSGQPQENMFTHGCIPVAVDSGAEVGAYMGSVHYEYDIEFKGLDPVGLYMVNNQLPTVDKPWYLRGYQDAITRRNQIENSSDTDKDEGGRWSVVPRPQSSGPQHFMPKY